MFADSMFRTLFLYRILLCCTVLALHTAQADPLRISTMQGLAFGTFSAGTGGSVVMSPSGARSAAGGVYLMSNNTGMAAQFMVTGNVNQVYSVSLPSSATLSSGSAAMQLSNFVSIPSGAVASTGLLTGGVQVLKVGATLQVGANQSSGSYSGAFNVTVNNN